jgi:hypothetical protein
MQMQMQETEAELGRQTVPMHAPYHNSRGNVSAIALVTLQRLSIIHSVY